MAATEGKQQQDALKEPISLQTVPASQPAPAQAPAQAAMTVKTAAVESLSTSAHGARSPDAEQAAKMHAEMESVPISPAASVAESYVHV